jgi:hypothetical protein
MKIRAASFLLAVLTIVSLSFSATAKEQVPISGKFVTEFVFTEFVFTPSHQPVMAKLTLSGTGWASHLGKATCSCDNEVVDFTQQPSPKMTGTLVLKAANGDKLIGEMDAEATLATDGSITFFGKLTFTGGSGRFSKASGTAEFGGTGTPTSASGGVGWFEMEGTVSSPGASKSKK